MIPGVKNHRLRGPGWEGNLGSWFRHWCVLEPQPWDTLQLGQEGLCKESGWLQQPYLRLRAGGAPGLVVTALFPLHGGPLPSSHSPLRVAWLGLLWGFSACLEMMPRLEMGIGRACQVWETLPWLTSWASPGTVGTLRSPQGGGFPVLIFPLCHTKYHKASGVHRAHSHMRLGGALAWSCRISPWPIPSCLWAWVWVWMGVGVCVCAKSRASAMCVQSSLLCVLGA